MGRGESLHPFQGCSQAGAESLEKRSWASVRILQNIPIGAFGIKLNSTFLVFNTRKDHAAYFIESLEEIDIRHVRN